jgi:glycerol-3-phosphate dehydrogenase (NAD(P)+)
VRAQQQPGKLAVLGAGSWGTALAIALAPRFGEIAVWSHNTERGEIMQRSRENARYLPGIAFPPNLLVTTSLADTVSGSAIVLSVVPSKHLRAILQEVQPLIPPHIPIVSATKGIEEHTLLRMSQLIQHVLGAARPRGVAVLSGPTFAREIAAGEPAAVVIASADTSLAEAVQQAFATKSLRLYASSDVVGVELGAALKNVIAIGSGICRGLGLGSNSIAALITRGLAEITRLAVEMGGHSRTLSGLAGMGDLVLTATSHLSRNRSVGVQLGQGRRLDEILGEMKMVAEGVGTCAAAYQLGVSHRVNLPIIHKMYEVLYQGKDPREGIRELMERPLTYE